MRAFSRILFPAVVLMAAATAIFGAGPGASVSRKYVVETGPRDTVIYPNNGYKLRRTANLEEEILHSEMEDSLADSALFENDSIPPLTLRDSLRISWMAKLAAGDTLGFRADSIAWAREDSIFVADSIARAKAEFEAWYNSLSRQERRKYDTEQKFAVKKAVMDSLRVIKEEKKDRRDSIIENTPRVLETFAVPAEMQYKRLLTWTLDQDFQKVRTFDYDTSYNYRYYDYPFQRKDVNATWLGVAGSPLQFYNFAKRESDEGVEFYKAYEGWSYSPRTITHFNTKTAYTELGYFGTLLAKDTKESDILHIFTTQNITPALNFSILFDRFGGGGMLENEETINKNFAFQSNYLGKKYMMHTGYIYNMVSRGENGGLTDRSMVRDTAMDARDVNIYLPKASSKLKKHTVYLDQEFRIPFTFINRIKAKKDSAFTFDPESLDRDITTAFIGHSSEVSTYTRDYTDEITTDSGRQFYDNTFHYNDAASDDCMKEVKLDNKIFMKLQPWASGGPVSKINVGIGDYLKSYRVQGDSSAASWSTVSHNSAYVYAGVEGQIKNIFNWGAKANYVFLGHDFSDFNIEAEMGFKFYPFRRDRKSPVSIGAHFSTSLKEPDFYQNHINTNHFRWDNDFAKTSTTRIGASLDIPGWKLSASADFALLNNNLYYDEHGIIRQNTSAMTVLSASLRKEFVLGPLHLDNRALFQMSSDKSVVPVPELALNLRYFLQFVVQRDETKTNTIMEMQIGVNGFYNTKWYAPGWNPNLGVFYNQRVEEYNNGPYFDIFMNIQWKRACIFVKYQNVAKGWPMKKRDYFSAHNYIVTQDGIDGLKLGVYWPFYLQPGSSRKAHRH